MHMKSSALNAGIYLFSKGLRTYDCGITFHSTVAVQSENLGLSLCWMMPSRVESPFWFSPLTREHHTEPVVPSRLRPATQDRGTGQIPRGWVQLKASNSVYKGIVFKPQKSKK